MRITTTWRNDNPQTVANALARKIGREPTSAELKEEVLRILREGKES